MDDLDDDNDGILDIHDEDDDGDGIKDQEVILPKWIVTMIWKPFDRVAEVGSLLWTAYLQIFATKTL